MQPGGRLAWVYGGNSIGRDKQQAGGLSQGNARHCNVLDSSTLLGLSCMKGFIVSCRI